MPSYFRFQELIWGFPRSTLGSQPTWCALWWLCVCVCVCLCVCVCVRAWPWTDQQLLAPRPYPHRFFEDLERRHKAQVCVEDISDILEEHAEHHFHPYISYCSNEVYQQRALQRLT